MKEDDEKNFHYALIRSLALTCNGSRDSLRCFFASAFIAQNVLVSHREISTKLFRSQARAKPDQWRHIFVQFQCEAFEVQFTDFL